MHINWCGYLLNYITFLLAEVILEEYAETLIGMEELAQTLQNATSDGTLGVEIDGELVYPDEDSLTLNGNLGCPNGLTSLNGLCGNIQFQNPMQMVYFSSQQMTLNLYLHMCMINDCILKGLALC